MKEIVSEQFSLSGRDFWKGLIVAALSPIVPIVMQSLQAGSFVFDWKAIGVAAASGFVAYIVKNFLEPTKVIDINPSAAKVEQVKNAA